MKNIKAIELYKSGMINKLFLNREPLLIIKHIMARIILIPMTPNQPKSSKNGAK